MSALADERAGIVAALHLPTGWQAHPILPDALVPPCAVLVPGAPYIEQRDGDTSASVTARFEVWLIADQGTNAVAIAALDEVIEAQADALTAANYVIESVAEPFEYVPQNTGGSFLTTTITVTTTLNLTS